MLSAEATAIDDLTLILQFLKQPHKHQVSVWSFTQMQWCHAEWWCCQTAG